MIFDKFEKEVLKFSIPDSEKTIALGLSGGSDSLALMLLLREYCKNSKINLIALTVNHHLRQESTEEAKKVSEIARKLGISHQILDWKHDSIESNIQHQARNARLNLLTTYCKDNKINYLFTGHTKDDVAETFLMNMFRGSGVYGLSSIPSLTKYDSINVVRPLLNFQKDELKNYLTSQEMIWIEDPSNKKECYLRTKVRNLIKSQEMQKIIPEYDQLIDKLALNARNLARARTELESACDIKIKEIVTLHEEGYITIKHDDFLKLNEEIGLKILSSCLITISGHQPYKPRLYSLERLYKSLSNQKNKKTLCGCEILIKKNEIFIYRELGKTPIPLEQTSNKSWIWDHRFEITAKNSSSITKINALNYEDLKQFNNKKLDKIPKRIWKSLPLITTYDTKVYVPFLNSSDTEEFSIEFKPLITLERTNFFF